MKKNILSMSIIAAAALALFSCTEVTVEVDTVKSSEGVPFEILANPVITKTVNDGMTTTWKATDGINLFHAEATTTDYSSNDQFTIAAEDLTTGTFRGTLAEALDEEKSYDWYALFPYNEGITTPANTTYAVSFSGNNRTQQGYNSTAHLTDLPLLGKANSVAATTMPSITMNNLAAVIKVVVTNNSGEGLTVTGVSITAPVKIVGGFIVDFHDPANLSYTDGAYSYNTANLKINSGTVIANGGNAIFYIPVKPFSLGIGDDFTIKVNTYEKTVSMGSAFSFPAGKVTTLNFNYDETFTSQNFTLASSIAAGDKVIFVNGKANGSVKVMGHYSSGNNIPAVSGTIEAGALASTAAMGIFTVAGNSSDGFSFYDPKNELYLNATSSKSNYLKGVAATDGYELWSASISDGVAELLNKGSGKTSYHIRYNSSSDLFSAYTTEQNSVYLFKLETRTPLTTYEFASTSVTKTPEQATSYTGQIVTSSPSVSSTYTMTGDDIGSINSTTGALELDGTEGTATITATFAGDETYMPASASYTITVAGTSLKPTFTFSSLPTGWPSGSKNSEIQALAGGSYDYVVSARTYTFVLSDDVGFHSGGNYLAVMSGKYVGLPQLSGYKLTKVVIGNSSSCSTSAKAKITSDTEGSTVVSGGAQQTFSTQGSTYTYTLSGTAANTMYYVFVSGNTQIISFALTYDKVE